jgi:hypothetical protein
MTIRKLYKSLLTNLNRYVPGRDQQRLPILPPNLAEFCYQLGHLQIKQCSLFIDDALRMSDQG